MKLIQHIEKQFPYLKKLLGEKELVEFAMCHYSNLHIYHLGFGSSIRNHLLKAHNNELYQLFIATGITNEDDMSSLIIELFFIYTKEQIPPATIHH